MKRIIFQQNPENLEINTGKVTYSLVLKDCPEDGCLDIYGFDISYRVQAEEELGSRYKRLEELIGLKSAECMEVNERLAKEIIERQRVEHIFRNNLRFLETLLDSIPSPVFQRDLNEVYVNCNESFARQIMGLPKEAVIGAHSRNFRKRSLKSWLISITNTIGNFFRMGAAIITKPGLSVLMAEPGIFCSIRLLTETAQERLPELQV